MNKSPMYVISGYLLVFVNTLFDININNKGFNVNNDDKKPVIQTE